MQASTDTEESVFQKFGGIRPMAAKLGVPSSTIKSWHNKRHIPGWRRDAVIAAAIRHSLDVSVDEVINVRADSTPAEPDRAAA